MNLFDLKTISRNYCHKSDISFFLSFTDVINVSGLYNCLYVYILSYPPNDCDKWNLSCEKVCFLSLSVICNKNSNL